MYPVCLRQANEAFNDRLLKLKVACRTDIGWISERFPALT
jgi:hypothetical protein